MLGYPLLDRQWRIPVLPKNPLNFLGLGLTGLAILLILVWRPHFIGYAVANFFLAALPEEWFFRAYFMLRSGNGWRANLLATALFAFLHGITRGPLSAGAVIGPSLFYGWLFQRTRNLPLLVLAHALSNLIYVTVLIRYLPLR